MANEMKYRPATMAEVEGRDVDLYMNGERVWVFMIHRTGTIGEDKEPALDYIVLTTMQKVQLEDLQVIDDDGESETSNSSDNNQNNSEDEVMTNETMKVADLIGKAIVNGNAKYVIKSVDGDKVKVDFAMGDNAAKEMNMKAEQIEKLLQGGWTVSDGTQEPTKQEAPKTEEPKAKTVKMETEPKPKQEKPKVTLRKKQPQTEAEEPKPEQPKGGLKFVTYMNGSKEQGRIMGFSADDEAYRRGSDFHGSAYPVNGVLCLSFSKKFTPFAKEVCQALNEGKTVDDVLAMLADYDAKRAAAKTERDAKREAKKQPSSGKVYTEAEMLDLMERVMRGDADALAEVNAIKAKAA